MLIPALAAFGAGVALLSGGDSASQDAGSPPPPAAAPATTPRLPATAGTFGRGRLIRDASATQLGDDVIAGVAVEGRAGARRTIQFRISKSQEWVKPDWPGISVADKEPFLLAARAGDEPCVVSVERRAPTLRCLTGTRWATVGKPSRIPGVRSINDVTERDGVIYATTGGTVKHRPVVQILRWTRDGVEVVGQVEGWAAQRGYFLNTTRSSDPLCGAYNRYSGPGSEKQAPFGTFCVRDGRVVRGLAPPSAFAELVKGRLPASTSGPVKYDVEPSTLLADGRWIVSMVALGGKNAGTLVLEGFRDRWAVTPLTSEKPKVFPYGGVWGVGEDAFLLNHEVQPQLNDDAQTNVRRLTAGEATPERELTSAEQGYHVPLGIFSRGGVSYALVSESAPSRNAKVSATPVGP